MENYSINFHYNRDLLLLEKSGELEEFLQNKFPERFEVQDSVRDLFLNQYPDEAVSILDNFSLSESERFFNFISFLVDSGWIFHVVHGDQRRGKDVDIAVYCEAIILYRKLMGLKPARFVTLMMPKVPPFVKPQDKYVALPDIPQGTKEEPVIVLCSELELVFPSRASNSNKDNDYLDKMAGTFAQCHQSFIGAVKIEYKADINIFRVNETESFKFQSPAKFKKKGIEREGVMEDPVALWLRPQNYYDKSETLLYYNGIYSTVHIKKPSWYNDEYSEQFRDIDLDFVEGYVRNYFTFYPEEKLARADILKINNELKMKWRKPLAVSRIREIFDSMLKDN